ncbi:MAG TPA: hypothetical protein VN833_28535 [Candidatus Acidoferrales bacterium]|jgi:hypothetical protein|nr:hypothetical protein [Candidatus Acidoferrales bacterium]
MNVAVPGVDPWSEVMRNPYIWHSAIHAIRNLPELLVRGEERERRISRFSSIPYPQDRTA